MTFTAKLLGATATAALFTSASMAGGIDRTGQSVALTFEEGRYLQFSGAHVMPEVDGGIALSGAQTGNSQADYSILGVGYRADVNENVSFAVIYDEPFGADVDYSNPTSPFAGTQGEINTQALTALVRYEMSDGMSLYGGLRATNGDANVAIPARGYSNQFSSDTGYGYVLGVAYEKPEIALRVSLTYNSEIDLTYSGTETAGGGTFAQSFDVTLPDSINLDFQTGVAPKTLVFGSIRWADYSEFHISPPVYVGAVGNPLTSYEDDVWAYSLGIGRAITDNFSMALTFGYEGSTDSASPSLFSPADGQQSVSLGGSYTYGTVKFNGGIRYTRLGDEAVTVPTGLAAPATTPARFSDNSAVSIGLSVGFQL